MAKSLVESEDETDERISDRQGPFIGSADESPTPVKAKERLSQFIASSTHYSKSQDDLLDIHIGNPLRRITKLLEEIKKQKAFSFTLKGSLGLAGVFLTLSVFGIFGGSKIFCDHGRQTQIGYLQTLSAIDSDSPVTIPILSGFVDFLSSLTGSVTTSSHPRVILIKSDYSVLHLPYSSAVDLSSYEKKPAIATGNYDSCAQSLTVKNPADIQVSPN